MKVLFIGGTGIISSACSQLAIERGIELYMLNRGQSLRPTPEGAHVILADIHDRAAVQQALNDMKFDVVVNWLVFKPEQIDLDLEIFQGKVAQYIFISSASVYQKPPVSLPITESTPLHNPFWEYSRNKTACEEKLLDAYRNSDFPVTIVRPSHTYDKTMLPMSGGYTMVGRMRQGKPVIVHGDGTSLWTLTHHRDFAKGFVGLLGHPGTIGQAYHITSDEWLSWNQIFAFVARAAGCEPEIVHIPSDFIARLDPVWGAGLLGDKAHSMIFDNSKVKRLVPDFVCTTPYARGAEEVMAWYDADPKRQVINPDFDSMMDRILEAYG